MVPELGVSETFSRNMGSPEAVFENFQHAFRVIASAVVKEGEEKLDR
ncbi:MAG: hypothetical protein LBR08_03480 [Bacteroidales bacterium]|jgi:hypothetical protein|nr:hypothetical protein [Bacteroidales bacterium]